MSNEATNPQEGRSTATEKGGWVRVLLSKMALLTLARVSGASFVFLLTLFVTRQFGPDTMAHFSLFLAMVSLLAVIFPIGFQAIGTMVTAEHYAAGEKAAIFDFSRYGYRVIALCAFLLAPVLFALAFLVPDQGGYNYPATLLFAIPTAVAMSLTFVSGSVLVGLERPYWGQLPDMLLRPTLMLSSFLILWFFWPNAGIFQLFGLALGIYGLIALIQAAALKVWFRRLEIKADKAETRIRKNWWAIAPNWMLITLLWDTFIEVHMLLAAWLVAPFEVAMLHVAFRIRQLAGFGMRALYSLLLPKVFAANSHGNIEEAQNLVRLATRITLVYALAAWVGMAIIGPYILRLFGKDFVEGQTILLIVMATMVVRAIFGPAPAILGMKRNQALVSRTLIASLGLSTMLILSGYEWGLFDLSIPQIIAIGYLASTSFTALVMWWMAMKKSGINSAIWS